MYPQQQTVYASRVTDTELSAFMRQVFNYMTGGVALSGLVAYLTANSPALLSIALSGVTPWVFMAVWLGFGFFAPKIIFGVSPAIGLGIFAAFSALTGFALTPLVLAYTGASVAVAFFTAAFMFGAASLYGYTTGKSLAGWGGILSMAMIGLLVVMLVNLGLNLFGINTGPLGLIMSFITVGLVTVVVAYETNMLRETYGALRAQGDDVTTSRTAIIGAVGLYTSFVTIFIHLLNILGQRNE